MTFTPGQVQEMLSASGKYNAAVAAAAIAAGVVILKAAPGRLCRVLVTIATTAAQPITIFDNASAGSGTVIGVIPGGSTAGQIFDFEMPANLGITIGTNASLAAGSITVSFE